MIGRWVSAFVVSVTMALAVVASANAQPLVSMVSISIVDAPRAQSRWGYAPTNRKISPGTWVTWSNDGQDAHTVTAVDGAFDSGNLDPSEGFSWYFDQPGTFSYLCSLHPWMAGKIVVGDGVAVDQPPVDSDQPPPDGD